MRRLRGEHEPLPPPQARQVHEPLVAAAVADVLLERAGLDAFEAVAADGLVLVVYMHACMSRDLTSFGQVERFDPRRIDVRASTAPGGKGQRGPRVWRQNEDVALGYWLSRHPSLRAVALSGSKPASYWALAVSLAILSAPSCCIAWRSR